MPPVVRLGPPGDRAARLAAERMTSLWFVAYSEADQHCRHRGETPWTPRTRSRRGAEATLGPERPRPRDPRVRAAVVEVRRRQGDRGPREVRHVVDPLLPGAQRAHRPARRRSRPTRCWSAGCVGCAPPGSGSARRAASASRSEPMSHPAPRNQRGVVFPSPVVMLSMIAVAMAGIAFVATRGDEPTEREVTTVARAERPRRRRPRAAPTATSPKPKPKPPVAARQGLRRGLQQLRHHRPGRRGRRRRPADVGWQVVGSDNWYGTIPATTVYYPPAAEDGGQAARPRPRHPAHRARHRPDARSTG